jgi:ABC-2 type transport system permease protein
MTALRILRRDLLRYLRNPGRTAMLFAIPLMMAAIFAVVFGGGGGESGITIKVLLWDEDDSLLGRLLQGAGDSPQAEGRLEVEPVGAEGLAMMDRGEASALVHMPPGFTRAVIDGTPTTVDVIKNPSERFLPLVVEEGAQLGATVLSAGSRAFRPELDVISSFLGASKAPDDGAVGALGASINRRMKQLDRTLFPPVVRLEAVDVGAAEQPGTGGRGSGMAAVLSAVLPGFAIMGLFFLAQSATRDMLKDREAGLVAQLLTAPVTPAAYLAGKCLSVLVVSGVGFALMVAAGAAAGVSWGDPAAVVALVVASAIAASGTLLLIMSVVRTERQGDALSTIVIMGWCLLGGAFVPLSQMPGFLRPIAATTLVYWATSAFVTLIRDGGSAVDIVPNLVVLAGAGALLIAVGAAVMARRLRRGEL